MKWGPTNAICHSVDVDRVGGSTWRWWGHLKTTFCNQTCLNFLYSELVGTQKPSFPLPLHPALIPLLVTTPLHALIEVVTSNHALTPWYWGHLNYSCSIQCCTLVSCCHNLGGGDTSSIYALIKFVPSHHILVPWGWRHLSPTCLGAPRSTLVKWVKLLSLMPLP